MKCEMKGELLSETQESQTKPTERRVSFSTPVKGRVIPDSIISSERLSPHSNPPVYYGRKAVHPPHIQRGLFPCAFLTRSGRQSRG